MGNWARKDGNSYGHLLFSIKKDFKCDSKRGRCISDSIYMPFNLRVKLIGIEKGIDIGKDILCPDNATICEATQTCCPLDNGDFGCCGLLHVNY